MFFILMSPPSMVSLFSSSMSSFEVFYDFRNACDIPCYKATAYYFWYRLLFFWGEVTAGSSIWEELLRALLNMSPSLSADPFSMRLIRPYLPFMEPRLVLMSVGAPISRVPLLRGLLFWEPYLIFSRRYFSFNSYIFSTLSLSYYYLILFFSIYSA